MPRILITIPEKSSQPYRFSLDRRLITIGRAAENDIVVACGSVSVHHAEVRRVDAGYELRDLGSTNGSKLMGERRDTITLLSGSIVHVGDVELEFTLSEEELVVLSKESETPRESRTKEFPAAAVPGFNRQNRTSLASKEPARGGVGSLLVITILAFAAFFAGLAVRHHKETGHSLIDSMLKKNAASQEEKTNPISPDKGTDGR